MVLHILKNLLNKVNYLKLFKRYIKNLFINKLILFYLITKFISLYSKTFVKTGKKINPEIPKIKYKYFYKDLISQIFWEQYPTTDLNVNKEIWEIINNRSHQFLLILFNQIKYLEKIELNAFDRPFVLNNSIRRKSISLLDTPLSVWHKNYAFDL